MDRVASDIATDGQIRRRRNKFKVYATPHERMSSNTPFPVSKWSKVPSDLARFELWFEKLASSRERFRWAIRDSLDELMDGQRTGRWCYQHLSKTEKTHLGTVIEVNLTKEFSIPNGEDIDWRVAGEDLDCKFSKDLGGWEIPMEMYTCEEHGDRAGKMDHPALLVWVNDDKSQWAAGLLRCRDEILRWKTVKGGSERLRAYNRDNKRRVGADSMSEIYWFWGGLQGDLPENTLLHMDADVRSRVLSAGMSGQQRVISLFREMQGVIVRRPIVLTVGQQDDAPKRVRDARLQLAGEGIIILGHLRPYPMIAQTLGLPVPIKGEWLSVRLTAVDASSDRPKVYYGDTWWAIHEEGDPTGPVPLVPDRHLSQPAAVEEQ